eukprot:1178203-Prymnesium_polylepis.1
MSSFFDDRERADEAGAVLCKLRAKLTNHRRVIEHFRKARTLLNRTDFAEAIKALGIRASSEAVGVLFDKIGSGRSNICVRDLQDHILGRGAREDDGAPAQRVVVPTLAVRRGVRLAPTQRVERAAGATFCDENVYNNNGADRFDFAGVADKETPYFAQGDGRFDSPRTVERRLELLRSGAIARACRQFWDTLRLGDGERVTHEQYTMVHRLVSRALAPEMGEEDWREACADDCEAATRTHASSGEHAAPRRVTISAPTAAGADDLTRASKPSSEGGAEAPAPENRPAVAERAPEAPAVVAAGAAALPAAVDFSLQQGLDFSAYVLSFFEIADLWTDCVSEVAYIVFINKLWRRITKPVKPSAGKLWQKAAATGTTEEERVGVSKEGDGGESVGGARAFREPSQVVPFKPGELREAVRRAVARAKQEAEGRPTPCAEANRCASSRTRRRCACQPVGCDAPRTPRACDHGRNNTRGPQARRCVPPRARRSQLHRQTRAPRRWRDGQGAREGGRGAHARAARRGALGDAAGAFVWRRGWGRGWARGEQGRRRETEPQASYKQAVEHSCRCGRRGGRRRRRRSGGQASGQYGWQCGARHGRGGGGERTGQRDGWCLRRC